MESGRNLRSLNGSRGKIMLRKSILTVIAVFLAIVLLLFLRVRGSISIKPEKDFQIPENVVCAFQKNPLWNQDKLGTSAYTMGSSDCLTTCLVFPLCVNRHRH